MSGLVLGNAASDIASREKVTERPEEKAEEEQVRRFFPESWLFSIVETK